MHDPREDVTEVLAQMRDGDKRAADKLLPLVYDELRALARHYLAQERANHTLQPTALLHEAYMKLRRYLRNPISLFILRNLPLRTRHKLARKLRSESRAQTRASLSQS